MFGIWALYIITIGVHSFAVNWCDFNTSSHRWYLKFKRHFYLIWIKTCSIKRYKFGFLRVSTLLLTDWMTAMDGYCWHANCHEWLKLHSSNRWQYKSIHILWTLQFLLWDGHLDISFHIILNQLNTKGYEQSVYHIYLLISPTAVHSMLPFITIHFIW